MNFIDSYFFKPNTFQKILGFLLLPLSFLFCLATKIKRLKNEIDVGIPVISIGNLTIGGSGKTPFLVELAKGFEDVGIISRGYGRKSQGVLNVSEHGKILCTADMGGDEPMLLAKNLPHASIIVAENRLEGIKRAKELGAKIIFLDDGFRHRIVKFDILLKQKREPYFDFCLPSGAYKEPKILEAKADLILEEGVDFHRLVEIVNPTEKMLLVTGIANPSRLDEYLPKSVFKKIYFKDHYNFKKAELEAILKKESPTSLLVTEKDFVKIESFNLPLSVMKLNLTIDESIISTVNTYIKEYHNVTAK